MEAFLALIILAVFIGAIAFVMRDLARAAEEPLDLPEAEPLGPMSVGTIATRMDVPRKHPIRKSRHSKHLP